MINGPKVTICNKHDNFHLIILRESNNVGLLRLRLYSRMNQKDNRWNLPDIQSFNYPGEKILRDGCLYGIVMTTRVGRAYGFKHMIIETQKNRQKLIGIVNVE
ncbi:MAG: hypothetical protein M3219_01465 [Thermoproteota archaeon]|nr:hypothetical protein [Thermoproteota archaeon]